jgi:hypothetical protein
MQGGHGKGGENMEALGKLMDYAKNLASSPDPVADIKAFMAKNQIDDKTQEMIAGIITKSNGDMKAIVSMIGDHMKNMDGMHGGNNMVDEAMKGFKKG